MKKLMMFRISENFFAIDQDFVKQQYKKEALFTEKAKKAKRVKIKLDGKDIPLYELPELFSDVAQEASRDDGEAMLIKDDEGHMVLTMDRIDGEVEVEKDSIQDLSPVFGERSCRYFPKVMAKDDRPVLILSPKGIRAYAAMEDTDID